MSDPITQPGERSRIAASDVDFRLMMYDHAAESKAWMRGHDKQDDERYEGLQDQIREIKEQYRGVNSSVTESQKEGTITIKTAIVGSLAGICALGALILSLMAYLKQP
jgi:hypothetical protein